MITVILSFGILLFRWMGTARVFRVFSLSLHFLRYGDELDDRAHLELFMKYRQIYHLLFVSTLILFLNALWSGL